MWEALFQRAVHVLPCRQFFWAEPAAGERFVRLALSRPPEIIKAGADVVCDYFAGR
jgi:hypothetical protein